MLEGVRILIDRMEATPEDFVYLKGRKRGTPKFGHIVAILDRAARGDDESFDILIHLTAEERSALLVAHRKMMRQAFTADVIASVFEQAHEEEKSGPQKVWFSPAQVKHEPTAREVTVERAKWLDDYAEDGHVIPSSARDNYKSFLSDS